MQFREIRWICERAAKRRSCSLAFRESAFFHFDSHARIRGMCNNRPERYRTSVSLVPRDVEIARKYRFRSNRYDRRRGECDVNLAARSSNPLRRPKTRASCFNPARRVAGAKSFVALRQGSALHFRPIFSFGFAWRFSPRLTAPRAECRSTHGHCVARNARGSVR